MFEDYASWEQQYSWAVSDKAISAAFQEPELEAEAAARIAELKKNTLETGKKIFKNRDKLIEVGEGVKKIISDISSGCCSCRSGCCSCKNSRKVHLLNLKQHLCYIDLHESDSVQTQFLKLLKRPSFP